MEKNYDFETKMLRKPLRKTSQNGDHCTVKTFKEAKSHWLPLLLTVALSLLMGQTWAQTIPNTATFSNNQWTVPENAGRIIIDCWGGGGGGATSTGSGSNQQGGGGGGGGFARSMYDVTATSTVKAGDLLRRVVGAQVNAGADGNASSVSLNTETLVKADGGKKGTCPNGGAGGEGLVGQILKQGGTGGKSYRNSDSYSYGGGGGGVAGYSGSVLAPSFSDGEPGVNAASYSAGSGGVGYGISGSLGSGGSGGSRAKGNDGTNYGGGGGGAAYRSSTLAGGKGAAGYVQVTYFIKYTITLNANGGTLIGESTFDVWEGETYGSALNANVPFYPGHIFDGWFTTDGERVSSTDVPTTDTTLVAHWTEGTAPISLADQVTFPSSTTWIAPEGTWKITSIEAWGGGGGGGNATTARSAGSGGGGGAYNKTELQTPNNYHYSSFDITVGAGGASGTEGNASIVKFGGNIILTANSGKAGSYTTRPGSGTSTQPGGLGGDVSNDSWKGGNGGQASINRDRGTYTAGAGGRGGNNGGAGGTARSQNSNGSGNPGAVPGGGGSGAINTSTSTSQNYGGAGGDGQVKIAYEVLRLNVSFVDNYEGGNRKDTIILYYDTIIYTPVREGYVFLGWYNQATGGAKFDFPTSGDYLLYNLTEDTTLYAHWLFPGAISSTPQTLRPCVAGGLEITSASEPDPSLCTYQWRYSYNGAEEVVVSGETEKDLTMDVPSTVGTYVYKRYVSIDGGTSWYQSANSCTVTVVERNAGKISLATAAEIFPCGSYTINNNVEADDVNTYQWRYVDAQGEHPVAEATGSSLTNAPNFTATGTYKFTRYIASTCGGYLPSDTVTITVTPIPGGTITANPTNVAPRHTYNITGSDAGEQFTYHWAYKKPGESNYTEISGATGKNLSNAPVLSAPGTYEFIRYTDLTTCNCDSGTATTSITVELEGDSVCFEEPVTSTSWTAPEGTYKVTIKAWGGGGAGGGAYRRSSTNYYGGGGGSGAYAANSITAQNFHSKPFSITVGAGGTPHSGTSAQNAKGGDGGYSSLTYNTQIYVYAGGGAGGTVSSSNNNTGGAGGEATTGATRTNGGNGANRANSNGGKGGDAPYGGTGGSGSSNNNPGQQGVAPGGGGGGSFCSNYYNTTKAGGAGGDGKVCISYEILKLQLTTNVNYGGAVNDTNLVLYYDTIPVSNPTRSEYVFVGWYDAPTGGNKVEFEKSGNVYLYNHNEDLNLYAHWKIDSGAIATGNTEILPCGTFATQNARSATTGSTYKWFYTKDGGNHFIEGATETTLSNFQLTEVGTYTFHRVALKAETGDSLVSDGTYTVTVRDVEGGTIAADPDNIVPGGTYSITSSEAETAQNTSFSWKYKNVDSTGFSTINGATNAELTSNQPTLSSEGKYVFVRTTTYSACATAIVKECSDTIQVKINPGAISGNTTIAPCGEFSIASETDAQGQSSYKWIYKKQSVSIWDTLVVNAATLSQADVTLNEPATYLFNRLAVNNVGGTTPTAQAVTITVNPISGGTITANSDTIAPRNTYEITGSDQGGQFTYQWAYKKPGESNYTNILGATGKDLSNAPVLSASGTYEFIRYTSILGCDCQSGTATCTLEVQLESHKVCDFVAGTTTPWTAPEGTYKVTIEAWGGGGAGGNVTTWYQAGSGGGGGAYLQTAINAPQYFHATQFVITVGQGGQNGENPTEGGDSKVTFNESTWTAGGGKSGVQAGYNNNQNGGQGGTPSIGNQRGTNGGIAGYQNGLYAGAGGAGANGGAGGVAPTSDGAGQPGTAPGGGGSGAYNIGQRNQSYTGGAGAPGQVCISYEILKLQLITNANYGDAVNDTNLVLYYDTIPVPNPTREGYVFAGWYDAPTDGNIVEFDSTDNKDYALYNKTEDMMLYAYWKVDAGTIVNNSARTICSGGNYNSSESEAVSVSGVTYSWKYTKWLNGVQSEPIALNVDKKTISQADLSLTEPGLYEFTRYIDAHDGWGLQKSDNTYKVRVVKPIQNLAKPAANYERICVGGKIELTPDLDAAKIIIPNYDDPSTNDELEAIARYIYKMNGSGDWDEYENNVTELTLSTATLRAVYTYENLSYFRDPNPEVAFSYDDLSCVAESQDTVVEIVLDPEFTGQITVSPDDPICPNGEAILTASDLSDITNDIPNIADYPYHYTWKVYDNEQNIYVDLGNEATYNFENNGKVAKVSNFLLTDPFYYEESYAYKVKAENALGCSAESADDNEFDEVEGWVVFSSIFPPTVTKEVTCPINDSIFDFASNVSGGDGYLWYADATITEENETPTYSLAAEDTVVWYVAVKGEECNSARVPDTLVIRYTSHIAQTSDGSTLEQTICKKSDIEPITFKFDGNSYPEYTGSLPAGVKAVIDTAAQTYTISGAPTEDGTFDFTVQLQNTGDCPQPNIFEGSFLVNPTPETTVYFTSCDHESITIGEGDAAPTFNTPGTYIVRLASSSECDSVVTLIYTENVFNQFGYKEENTLLAGWSSFRNSNNWNGKIPADCENGVASGSVIMYNDDEWGVTSFGQSSGYIGTGDNLQDGNALCNLGSNSLALPSCRGGLFGFLPTVNNNSTVVMKTSTKDYGLLKLHFNYKTESSNGLNDKSLSAIKLDYKLSEDGVWNEAMGEFFLQMDQTGAFDISTFPEEMFDQENIWIRFTFSGAAVSVAGSTRQDLLLDNICLSGYKGISDVQLDNEKDTVCLGEYLTLTASDPYVNTYLRDPDNYDTTDVIYTWTKTIPGGSSETMEERGNILRDQPTVDGTVYKVSVGRETSACYTSYACTVKVNIPIDRTENNEFGEAIIREQSWCSCDLSDFKFYDSVKGDTIEGARILTPSIADMQEPGTYTCRLSIPLPDDATACDSIIRLDLTVLKSYNDMIYANICLGDEYHANGFDIPGADWPELTDVGTQTFVHTGSTTLGCDSIVTVVLTTNSVKQSLTNLSDQLMVVWPLNNGLYSLYPKCGNQTAGAKMYRWMGNGIQDMNEGSSFAVGTCYEETQNQSFRLANGNGGNGGDYWGSYEGTNFEIKINPYDYENLKLNFDYKKEIDEENSDYTNVNNAFSTAECYYKFNEQDEYQSAGTIDLTSVDWDTASFDLHSISTLNATQLYLKVEFYGGQKGNGRTYSTPLTRHQYYPAYLFVDNVLVSGDKPARAILNDAYPLATFQETGAGEKTISENNAISICRDEKITFTSQIDDAYLHFFLQDPDGNEFAFNGKDTMSIVPQVTGNYKILARDINGCDSAFVFPVTVNDYPIIGNCTAPYVCSDADLVFAPEGASAGTTYSWEPPTQTRHIVSTSFSRGENEDSLRTHLISDTSDMVTAVFSITPSTGGCKGPKFNCTVNVLPAIISSVITPENAFVEKCPSSEVECQIKLTHVRSLNTRQVVWNFNGSSDTVPYAEEFGDVMVVSRKITLPETPCDTTYKLYATYTDATGCIAKDTITLKVDIPAHSFTFAEADNDTVYCWDHATEPDASLVPTATSGCDDVLSGVLVGSEDNPIDHGCVGTRTYTYKYTDCKGQDTTWSYVYHISHKAPTMREGKEWPEDSVNQPRIFAEADTSCLYSDDQVKALYQDNCGGSNITVTHTQSPEGTENCGWKYTRTYTIANTCGDTVSPKPTMSVSGNDQNAPTYTRPKDTVAYLTLEGTVDADTSKTGVPSNVTDNSGNHCDTTYRDEEYIYACGVTFNRIWRVTDACGNVSKSDSVQKITVKDTLTPRINGTWKNDTVYLTNVCGYTLPDTLKTVVQVNTLKEGFIKGQNLKPAITMTQDTTDKGGCGMFITRTYTVTDSCSEKSAKFTHKIVVKDTLTPSIAGNWADSTVNMDVAGHYELPTKFTSVAALNAMRADFIRNCNINDNIVMTKADTTGEGTCGLKVTRTYQVTESCSGKSKTFTHTITVGDTVKPVIASRTWTDSTVCWTLDTTYKLPEPFATIEEVNAKVPGFITGNNLVPALTVKADTVNRNTCGMYVVRTYTVTDSCNHKDSSFTHTIKVVDTLTPRINGTWGDSIVYLTAACGYTLPAAYTMVSQLNTLNPNFVQGPNIVESITLKKADTTEVGKCGWKVVRTYAIADSCSKDTATFTHTIAVKDTIAPKLAEGKLWLKDSLNQNALFAHADTAPLADDDSVKKLFFDCTELTVTFRDDTLDGSDNCSWQITRIYTITDDCNNSIDSSVVISGGDQTKPTFTCPKDTILYLSADCQVDTAAASMSQPTALADNSDVTPTVTHTNEAPVSDCGNTYHFNRVWKVTDACGNDSIQKQLITVMDTTRPAIAGTLTNDTVYLNDHTCDAYQLTPAMTTVGAVRTHSGGLSITDCNVSDATEITVDSVEYGAGTCDHYFIRTYTVTDSCTNSSTFTHKIVVMDTLTPSIAGNWADSTVNMDAAGHYELPTKFTSVAALNAMRADFIQNCNINDNIVMTKADTTGEGTCGLKVTRTYKVTDTCNNKSKTFTHTITVGDTVKPVIASRTWTDSTVCWTLDTTYKLPEPFATIEEVNAKVPDFITGNNLVPDLKVNADTVNRNTCEMYVVRTYTVTDSCNHKDSSFTHKILVKDTLTPRINGTWKNDTVYLTNVCGYTLPDAYTMVSQLNTSNPNFVQGPNIVESITLKKADTTEVGKCGWKVVRTYAIADSCSKDTATFTHTIAVKDTIAPKLAEGKLWLKDSLNQNALFADASTAPLADNDSVKKLFFDCTELTVTHKDDTVLNNDCGWKIRRTYTITDDCGNKKVDSVFIGGGDQTKPTFTRPKDTVLYLSADCQVDTTTTTTLTPTDVDDNSDETPTVTYRDANITAICGKAFEFDRIWRVVDECGNVSISDSVQHITVKDTTKPTFTRPADYTTYKDANCLADTSTSSAGVPTNVKDNCTETPTVTYRDETMVTDCGSTYHFNRIWRVVDECGNVSISDSVQKITVMDTTRPTFTRPADYTTYKDANCLADTSTSSAGEPTNVKDNCTASPTVTYRDETMITDCGSTYHFDRIWRVVDECGNVSISDSVQKITVKDTTRPTFTRPADTTLYLSATNTVDTTTSSTRVPTNVTDNCTAAPTVTYRNANITSICGNTFEFDRIWRVVDECGNVSIKDSVQHITVTDTIRPIINGTHPQVYTQNTNAEVNTFTKESTNWDVTATDNNAGNTITISYELTDATTGSGNTSLQNVVFNTGKTIVTWTVEDVCGNDTTCTDTIKIINVNPITVYISENTDTVTYDGQEHSLTGYHVDSISNELYTTDYFRLKPSASNDTIVKGTLAGSYSMNLDENDFENVSPYFNNIRFAITDNNFVVKKNQAVITIASGSHTFDASEYDGQPHYFPSYVVKYNGETMPRTAQDSTKFVLPAGDTLSVTPTGYVIDARETAEHNNTFTWELQHADCYANEIDTNGLVGTIHFNAFPQPIVISSETMTWTYDGNAHSYPKYTVKFGDEYATRFEADTTKFILPITGDTVRIHSTASITDAGKVANTFTYTIDNDVIYVGERDTIVDTLYVLPLGGVVVTITENTDTVTYDGTPHSVTGYEVTNISSNLYHVADFTYNGQVADTTASGTYAGTYPMNVLSTQFANTNSNFSGVTFTIVDQDLVINPIQSNIQITAKSAEKNYDGTPLTEAGYTHTMTGALVAGDTIVAVVTGSQTEVGSSANVVTAYYVLRKISATTFDTITYCYTFATPATVNGTLLVNKALAIVSKDSVDVDCYGNHNGTATIVVEGGKLVSGMYAYTVAGPNSYSVSGNIGTTLSLTGLYPGAYTVTFKDGLDSTLTATFSINEPDTLVAEITAPEELCPNQGSYPVSVTATGGNGSNAYVWGSNATDVNATSTEVVQTAASDCGTEYTAAVQVTDAKGCVAKDTVKFTVVDDEDPTFTAPRDITLCRNADGEIDAPTSVTGVPTNYSDNCSNEATMIRHTTFRDIDTTGTLNTLMVIRREWTVTDSCGNSVADTQRISIKPSIAGSDYVLTVPADIEVTLRYGAVDTLLENIGMAVATNIPQGIATPEITNNKPENDRYPEGINYVVWTATDECGFTVVDTQTIIVNYPPCDPVTYYGYEYPAVRIGGNCWLAENLHNTQYADGEDVPNYSSYNNDGNMTANYGLLYSWYSAVRVPENNDNVVPEATVNGYVQGLCPDDWALPKQTDFDALMNASGTTNVLKDVNAQYWLPGAAGITPSTGFDARGAGYYDASIDRYMNLLGEVYFWSSEAGATVTRGKCSVITHYCPELINYEQNKVNGFSVRCIRKR